MRKGFLTNFFFFCLLTYLPGMARENRHADQLATKETVNLYNNLKKTEKGFLFGHPDDLAYGVGWNSKQDRRKLKPTNEIRLD